MVNMVTNSVHEPVRVTKIPYFAPLYHVPPEITENPYDGQMEWFQRNALPSPRNVRREARCETRRGRTNANLKGKSLQVCIPTRLRATRWWIVDYFFLPCAMRLWWIVGFLQVRCAWPTTTMGGPFVVLRRAGVTAGEPIQNLKRF